MSSRRSWSGVAWTLPANEARRLAGRVGAAARRPGYDGTRTVWNAIVDRRPRVIMRCASVPDVVTAVRTAREHDLEIGIRCGGHSAAGHAVPDGGLMIDLTPMRAVRVDPGGAGRSCRAVRCSGRWTGRRQQHGLAVTAGNVSHTGVGGLTLGGGMGWLARQARPGVRQRRVLRGRHRRRRRGPGERERAPRPLLGAAGRWRQLRCGHRVRVPRCTTPAPRRWPSRSTSRSTRRPPRCAAGATSARPRPRGDLHRGHRRRRRDPRLRLGGRPAARRGARPDVRALGRPSAERVVPIVATSSCSAATTPSTGTRCAGTRRATTSASSPTRSSTRCGGDRGRPVRARSRAAGVRRRDRRRARGRHRVQPPRHGVRARREHRVDRSRRGRGAHRDGAGRTPPRWSRSPPASTSTSSVTRAPPAYAGRTQPRSWPGSPPSRTPTTRRTSSTSTRTSSPRARRRAARARGSRGTASGSDRRPHRAPRRPWPPAVRAGRARGRRPTSDGRPGSGRGSRCPRARSGPGVATS